MVSSSPFRCTVFQPWAISTSAGSSQRAITLQIWKAPRPDFPSLGLCPVCSSCLGLPVFPNLQMQGDLGLFLGFSLPMPEPGKSEVIVGFILHVSHLSGITVLRCLMSNVLKSILCFFVCLRQKVSWSEHKSQ